MVSTPKMVRRLLLAAGESRRVERMRYKHLAVVVLVLPSQHSSPNGKTATYNWIKAYAVWWKTGLRRYRM